MLEDEGDDFYESFYENGHWEWNYNDEELVFIFDILSPQDINSLYDKSHHRIEFRNGVDIIEQNKFKKRLQRKAKEDDVVTLQDVKDIVLFTTPKSALTPAIIGMLHKPTTERFLRALILYSQYFLQISDKMTNRMMELDMKIRSELTAKIELKYREDLEDLRLLVAKEYCIIILGGEGLTKYHHMGLKKLHSLIKRDSIFYKTILNIAIQIVWIALGRKSYNLLELEINRLLKSEHYNTVKHVYNKAAFFNTLTCRENDVMRGKCLSQGAKLNTLSPLINEVFCTRHKDFREVGLGVIKFSGLNHRLLMLETLLSIPEIEFRYTGVTLGIIGLNRSRFDVMLHGTEVVASRSNSNLSEGQSRCSVLRRSRLTIKRKSTASVQLQTLFPDITLPDKTINIEAGRFPEGTRAKIVISKMAKQKWLKYLANRKRYKTKV